MLTAGSCSATSGSRENKHSIMDDRAFVFLDSNVLLHFRPPNEIDWRKLCGTKRVDLVIYRRLRTDISNHKDLHIQKSVRARAGVREA